MPVRPGAARAFFAHGGVVMSDREAEQLQVNALVTSACAGDEAAWRELWRWLEAPLNAMIRQFHMGRISHDDDERRAVVVEVMARLREDDFRRLGLFAAAREQDPRLQLLPWIKVVARRVAIDHMRSHPNYVAGDRDQAGARGPGQWKDPTSLPPASLMPGVRPAMTRDGTARQMLDHARQVLPEAHFRALELKMQGEDAEAIARVLGLTAADEADKIVRAAFERLRRKFRTSITGGGA
jgi:hypothetical protein